MRELYEIRGRYQAAKCFLRREAKDIEDYLRYIRVMTDNQYLSAIKSPMYMNTWLISGRDGECLYYAVKYA